jgi:hypothetical protein
VLEVLLAHSSPEPPPSLDPVALEAPEPLCALVARLLAKDPAARPHAAKGIVEDLRAFASPISPRRTVRRSV